MTYDEFFTQVEYNEYRTVRLTFGSVISGVVLTHPRYEIYFSLLHDNGSTTVIHYADVRGVA